ncbi:MAG: dihydropteroate synthase [Candidatus Hydrogenedentota bacterium]|nr:MAG: dihydropteroate synthase [Candidatus Hydrogenedentota bacterium]
MLVVGERINTSRKPIAEATEKRDSAFILNEARLQAEAGAHFIDVNAGTFAEREKENLTWLVKTLCGDVAAPLCIDSSDPDVIGEALQLCDEGTMVNSITSENEKYKAVLPLIKAHRCKVVALYLDDEGVPTVLQKKLNVGFALLDNLLADGIEADNIYADPLVMAISTVQDGGILTLKTIEATRNRYPDIHIICGVSNISFGVPVRTLLNRSFLAMAMAAGLDAVILDPLDKRMMATLIAANALLGKDDYCSEYIAAYRNKRLE